MLQQGEIASTNLKLKRKLEALWGIANFKVILGKGGVFHILLNYFQDQGMVIAKGAGNLKSGVHRVSRWHQEFDPINYKISKNQVWIRLHDLPLEYKND